MPKKVDTELMMKDGMNTIISATPLSEKYAYHKEGSYYILTHIPSGVLVTTAKKVKNLKALVQYPEFFKENASPVDILRAVNRWNNDNNWDP